MEGVVMDKVLETNSIENYLKEAQKLKVISTNDPEKLEILLDFVDKQKGSYQDSPENTCLFKGEHAFHSGNYEQALMNYMQARQVPNFEFFCYRATAYVSFIRRDLDKAKSFIHKTLEFNPDDYDTLKLYHEILIQSGNQEEAKKIKEKLSTIESENSVIKRHLNTAQQSTFYDKEINNENSSILEEFYGAIEKTKKKEEGVNTMDKARQEWLSFETPTNSETLSQEATSQFIATKLGVDLDAEKALESHMQEYQKMHTKKIQNYLEESKQNRTTKNDSLYILNGWNSRGSAYEEGSDQKQASDVLLREQSRQNSGGFYIRWNGMGVVINPGSNFLENLHKQGLYIQDINFVIVTQDTSEANADIKRIYDLNYQLNKISPELHVIHYYINHKAYQTLSHVLKPNFKQERNTVHSLELFLDSPDVESEVLAEGIILSYFSTSSRGGYISNSEYQGTTRMMQPNCVGIRLDLKKEGVLEKQSEAIRVGYVSATAWSPLLAHHLGHCDILMTGFGTTNPNDYGKLNYNENSLGYFGTYTLFEEVRPKLLLCSEFDGRDGDIRLEIVRKLRAEYKKANRNTQLIPAILPADNGLFVELSTQQVECSISKTLIDSSDVVVVKSSGTYGKLQYLSPSCILSNS